MDKIYYQKHKDKILLQMKEYYQKNRIKVLERVKKYQILKCKIFLKQRGEK